MQSFSDLAIPDAIKKALDKLKFNTPTEIQKMALPVALEGQDIIACASTGSGKTGAFGIPALTMVLNNPDKNALILAPTRELAQQISEFMRELTLYSEGITMVSLVGGFDMGRQLNALRRKPRIIIATPGRLTDHLRRRSVNLTNTGILILDEGDRMLDMGFAPQLDVILQFLPTKRQTMLFTATLPPKVKSLASRYLHKPQEVMVGNTSQPVDTVAQSAVVVPQDQKNEKLISELETRTGSVIVFARTQRRTDSLTEFLEDAGVRAVAIHGGLTQGRRNRAIQGFKQGHFRVLVATDIAARGIDVPSVEHVVNFDLPLMDEDYVHRIGRTGRNGAKGEAVSFVSHQEFGLWSAIAHKYNVKSDIIDPRRRNKSKSAGGGRSRERNNRFDRNSEQKPFARNDRNDFNSRPFKKKDDSFYTTKEFSAAEIEERDSRTAAPREFTPRESAPRESSERRGFSERREFDRKRTPFRERTAGPREFDTQRPDPRRQNGKSKFFDDAREPRGSKPFINSFFEEASQEPTQEKRFDRGPGGFKKKTSFQPRTRPQRDDFFGERDSSFKKGPRRDSTERKPSFNAGGEESPRRKSAFAPKGKGARRTFTRKSDSSARY